MQVNEQLLHSPLFRGFDTNSLEQLLALLGPVRRHYQKGETAVRAGEELHSIGVVLSGRFEAEKHTAGGARFLVQRLGRGAVFGDVLSGSHTRAPVTVVAATTSEVLFLPFPALFQKSDGESDALRGRLLQNLVAVISDKYFVLDRRLDLLLIRGLRRRLAAYLLAQAEKNGSPVFTIPYTRAGLADFLGCERSALSREISRMAAEGLITTQRSHFELLQSEALRQLV